MTTGYDRTAQLTSAEIGELAVTYQRGALPTGPFEANPLDLQALLTPRPDGDDHCACRTRILARMWLTEALTDAGVSMGLADEDVVTTIAGIGLEDVQVVAGWIVRAGSAPPPPR